MFTEFNNSKWHHFIGFMDGCLSLPHCAALFRIFLTHTHTYTTTSPPATITMAPFGVVLWKTTGGFPSRALESCKSSHSELQGKATYNTQAGAAASPPYMVTGTVTQSKAR